MKFNIKNEILIKNLQKVNRLLTKNISLPILENILLEIKDGILSLISTNLETELIAKITIKNEYIEGNTVISGRKLLDICRNTEKNTNINIYIKKNKMYINSENSNYVLTTLPADNFPKNQDTNYISEFNICSEILKNMIEKTAFSMGKQDVRYYLNGMLLEKKGKILYAVATDGYRLAISHAILKEEILAFSIIIPRKGIVELLKLLKISPQLIRILINHNNIKIYIKTLIFTIQLLEGQYPDYNSVLFKTVNSPIILNCITLKKALSRVVILSNEKFCGIDIHISKNQLKVLSNNQEEEKAEDQFLINYSENMVEISINAYYILDILNIIHSQNIFLFINKKESSIQVTEENNSSAIYVIMLLKR